MTPHTHTHTRTCAHMCTKDWRERGGWTKADGHYAVIRGVWLLEAFIIKLMISQKYFCLVLTHRSTVYTPVMFLVETLWCTMTIWGCIDGMFLLYSSFFSIWKWDLHIFILTFVVPVLSTERHCVGPLQRWRIPRTGCSHWLLDVMWWSVIWWCPFTSEISSSSLIAQPRISGTTEELQTQNHQWIQTLNNKQIVKLFFIGTILKFDGNNLMLLSMLKGNIQFVSVGGKLVWITMQEEKSVHSLWFQIGFCIYLWENGRTGLKWNFAVSFSWNFNH